MLFRISVSLVHSSSGLHWPDNSELIFRAAAQWRTRSHSAGSYSRENENRATPQWFPQNTAEAFSGGSYLSGERRQRGSERKLRAAGGKAEIITPATGDEGRWAGVLKAQGYCYGSNQRDSKCWREAFPANKRSAVTEELAVAERQGSLGDVAAERNSPFLFVRPFTVGQVLFLSVICLTSVL